MGLGSIPQVASLRKVLSAFLKGSPVSHIPHRPMTQVNGLYFLTLNLCVPDTCYVNWSLLCLVKNDERKFLHMGVPRIHPTKMP